MGVLSYIVNARSKSFRTLKLGGWFHSILTLGAGVTWGWGAILSASLDAERFLIYTLALGGTALGVVSSQHSVLRSALLSIWSSLLLLAVAHLTSSELEGGWMTPTMMLVYGLVLTVMTARMHRFVSANHQLASQLRQRVRVEEQLTEKYFKEQQSATSANLAKSRFLAHASHDLRQPVQAIAVLAQNLETEDSDEHKQDLVKGLKSSVSSLAGLLKSLLDLSALDLGKIEPKVETLSINTLFEKLDNLNKDLAESSGCDLRFARSSLKVKSDPNLLFNIVQNLLSNAFKHAPGSSIVVGMKRQGETVSLCVLDRGPGISPELQELVFSEFYRGEHTHGTTEGLGLGLTLVAKYTGLLNLDVQLSSDVGRGVSIQLNGLRTTQDEVLDVERKTPNLHKLNGFQVSIIANQASDLEYQTLALLKWGCEIKTHESFSDAIASGNVVLVDGQHYSNCAGLPSVPEIGVARVVAISDPDNKARIQFLFEKQSLHSIDRSASLSKLRALLTSISLQR